MPLDDLQAYGSLVRVVGEKRLRVASMKIAHLTRLDHFCLVFRVTAIF